MDHNLRSAKDVGDAFPYCEETTPFILIEGTNRITYAKSVAMKRILLEKAWNYNWPLIAVWPGRWTSDAFWIDDLDVAYAALEAQ